MKRLLIALAILLGGAETAQANDPRQIWRTLKTEHFYIHYYKYSDAPGEEPVAQRVAVVAEDSHRRLIPYLGPGLSRRRRTHVVITDQTDDANGSAGVTPYPAIFLNATSPDDRSFLNDYDDWLSALFTHEYTHILHLGTIGGPCAFIANILLGWGAGFVYAPNQAQPRWLIEGLAVFEESERTSGGRLRNSIWDMFLRMATLEKRFERLDQFTNDPIQFPFGNSAYLYGSSFMRYVAAHYGQDKLQRWARDYGSVCIPGGFNRAIRHATGHTWSDMYGDFRRELEVKYSAQRDALAARGLTPVRHVTPFRENATRPIFVDGGHDLLFADTDGQQRPQIRRLDVSGALDQPMPKLRTERKVDAAGGLSIAADGRTLAYHAVEIFRTFYAFDELYVYDLITKKTRKLTDGARATNPAISPDGSLVAYETNRATSRGLGLYHMESGATEELIPPSGFEQVYTPAFSPDGKTLAFSWWKKGGYRDIWLMDVATRALTRITEDRSLDVEPVFSPDGKYLYFSSDRTEIYNLYAYDLADKKLYQATNVVSGVFDPNISPDGKRVAFVGFVADGYDIELADLDPSSWREAVTPLYDRPEQEVVDDHPPLPSRAYSPFPTVLPFIFRPYAQPDGYGEILGFMLSGSDAAQRHAWSLNLGFGTGRADDVTFAANYTYSGVWPTLNLGVSHALLHKGGLVINGQDIGYDEDDWTVGTSISLPILRRIAMSSDLTFSYSWSYARRVSGVPRPDPSNLVPVYPQTGSLAALAVGWSFSNVRRYTYSVSAEEGRSISVYLAAGPRLLGAQHDTYSISWRWDEYVPMPWRPKWLRGHVLAIGYGGGVSGSDSAGSRGLYFLGGYPPQNLLQSIYDLTRPGQAPLRGYAYASVVGDQFHVLNVEYRFPIAWIERGYQTLPLYLRRVHGKVFADYGGAFFGDFSFDKLRFGVGGELLLELQYAYFYFAALQLGYAHGFDKGGGDQVYFLLNYPF